MTARRGPAVILLETTTMETTTTIIKLAQTPTSRKQIAREMAIIDCRDALRLAIGSADRAGFADIVDQLGLLHWTVTQRYRQIENEAAA
jgi:hypothetical protein